jgi:hypothetical protein
VALTDPIPCGGSLRVFSAALKTLYRCGLTVRVVACPSKPVKGELGREGDLLRMSGIAVGGLKLSYCLEYRLFPADTAERLPDPGCFGEPEEDGV